MLRAGTLQTGDAVQFEPYGGASISAVEVFRGFFDPHLDETTMRRYLAAPIHMRARQEKERQRAKLLGDSLGAPE